MSFDGLAFARRQRHVNRGVRTVENHTRIARAEHVKPKVTHQVPRLVRPAASALAEHVSEARYSGGLRHAIYAVFAMGNPWTTSGIVECGPRASAKPDTTTTRAVEGLGPGAIVGDQTVIGWDSNLSARGEPFGNLFRSQNSKRHTAK